MINNMKYAVIDIGSNSVRLMMSDGIKTLYKNVKTTRLAESMGEELILKVEPIDRTARAVSFFVEKAKNESADKILIFATAAVRRAKNKSEFLSKVKELCGIDVDVISGETEAKLGVLGALNGGCGGIIDVGGASTEISVISNGENVFTKSIYVGAVNVTDKCGQNIDDVSNYVNNAVKEFGDIPSSNFFAVGGTATSLASICQELEPYDPNKTHGYVITISDLKNLTEKLFSMTVSEREKLKGLQPERAKVIASGAYIVYEIMKIANLKEITVSESDNLEGYLKFVMEKL